MDRSDYEKLTREVGEGQPWYPGGAPHYVDRALWESAYRNWLAREPAPGADGYAAQVDWMFQSPLYDGPLTAADREAFVQMVDEINEFVAEMPTLHDDD